MGGITNIINISAGVFIISMFAFATCGKDSNERLVSGKIIYRSCATTAVEITDPDFFYLGQDDWQQDPASPVKHHVFSVLNPCKLPHIDSAEVFRFKILEDDGKNDCIICMMYDNPPQKKQLISVVK